MPSPRPPGVPLRRDAAPASGARSLLGPSVVNALLVVPEALRIARDDSYFEPPRRQDRQDPRKTERRRDGGKSGCSLDTGCRFSPSLFLSAPLPGSSWRSWRLGGSKSTKL